ncbi:hypothetical protein N9L68_06205 [bacterium]|nr:hypothetical protein [bacterium]
MAEVSWASGSACLVAQRPGYEGPKQHPLIRGDLSSTRYVSQRRPRPYPG